MVYHQIEQDCPKCGRTFKSGMALATHRTYCYGRYGQRVKKMHQENGHDRV